MLRGLQTVEKHLSTRTYLVTERITLADITLASVIYRLVALSVDAPIRAQLPNLIRHLETVVNQPALKDIFGPIPYTEKARQYTPPPKEKKEAKPAAPAAPKAEKKPKAKEVEEDDDDDDLVPKEEPKAKNPLDSLPKSSFNLEDWKRAYSNKDTRGADGALEWFYQKSVSLFALSAILVLFIDDSSTALIRKDSLPGVWTSSTMKSSLKLSCPRTKSEGSSTVWRLPVNTFSGLLVS